MLTILSLVAAFLLGFAGGVSCFIQFQGIITASIMEELERRGYLRWHGPKDGEPPR